MKLQEALNAIERIIGGDRHPFLQGDTTLPDHISLAVDALNQAIDRTFPYPNEKAFWNRQLDICYWSATATIVLAAIKASPDNLPDVPAPVNTGSIAEDCYAMRMFARKIMAQIARLPEDQ